MKELRGVIYIWPPEESGMPKAPTVPDKRGRGRPTKYQPDFAKMAELMARAGATRDEIADRLNVDRSTVIRWLNQHEEFRHAVNVGTEVFKPRVERAIADRAIGFYADKYIWRKTTKDERKKDNDLPEWVLEPTERVYYPPDTTACIYWTKNRIRERWADVQKVEQTTQLKSSDQLLTEIVDYMLKLRDLGCDLTLPALPARKDGSDT